jgi:hypothetical protein
MRSVNLQWKTKIIFNLTKGAVKSAPFLLSSVIFDMI